MERAALAVEGRLAVSRRPVLGWALYDLANTIFSMNIVTLYFPLWVVHHMGGRDADYGLASSLSMVLILLTAPLIGALSDQLPRRMPLLIVSTLLCFGLTALLGTWGLAVSLLFFVAANYFFQAGLIVYDALLPAVSTEENRGRVGGLGIGLGYLGSFIGVAMGLTVLQIDETAMPLVFQLTALLFLLFAIPCFVWVREPRRAGIPPVGAQTLQHALVDLRGTLARLRRYPDLRRFLVGRVFYTDAANTIIIFMAIYVTTEAGFTEAGAQLLLMAGIVGAVAGGLSWGLVVDRIGPKRALNAVLLLWMALLSLVAAIGFLDLPGGLFWVIAPLAGTALAGTWAADRPYMLILSPPRHVGQFYGLYAMMGRFAAIIGPLKWSLIVDGLGWGRPAAVASLVVMVAIALVLLRPVRDTRREWSSDELLPVA